MLECINAALASDKDPFFISDSGDNSTAGRSGDMTLGLMHLLARPNFKQSGQVVIYASVPGSKAVKICVEAGVGVIVTVTAGAKIDDNHSGPITMTGKMHAIVERAGRSDKLEIFMRIPRTFMPAFRLHS